MLAAQTDVLAEKDRLEYFLRQSGSPLSAASFMNVFLWQDFFDFRFDEIDGNLCVFAADPAGTFLYLPPLGKTISARAVEYCFHVMTAANQGSPVTRIENVPASCLNFFDPRRHLRYDKFPDYVYRRRDIAALAGGAYESQRWSYNHFVRNYRHDFIPYEPSFRDECVALYTRWAGERHQRYDDPVHRYMLADNEQVHRRILDCFRPFELTGRVVRVDGEIAGYTFGYQLNEKTFCIVCEITDLSIKGLSAFIFREFCRDAAVRPYELINVMDDSGLEHIRAVKMSYRPVEMPANHIIVIRK